ncbi:PREDICTED: synaptonemal complex protein 2-like [Fragaria vesca subsp. vesca]
MQNTKLKKSTGHIRALGEKLQNAFNENAKFKVKLKEDEKLWKGLESKFSSTKTLCDQLTETLQLFAGQVQDAEKDKEAFEGKLSASTVALDGSTQQMNDLSIKLESAEETIRNREKELEERRLEKEETDKLYRNEQCRTANLIEEKDAMIKNFEETLATNRLATESLNTKLGEVHLELKLKEDEIRHLVTAQENLETEKHDLHLSNDDLVKRLDMSFLKIRNLEGFVHVLASHLAELDRHCLNFLEKFDKLNSLDLSAKLAQRQYDQLHNRFLNLTSEKGATQLVNQELNNRVMELQKVQESTMSLHTEESRTARERIQKLEFETEALVSELELQIETEKLVSELELQIDSLSESSRPSENKMQDLLIKISALETENKDNAVKLQAEIEKKGEQIDDLLKQGEAREQHVDLMDKQVSQLHSTLEEKEQLIVQYKERGKNPEEQITENRALLTAAETRLMEDKKQCDLMLENKQLDLSRHLKDISQRNDQAINDIRKKYEVEKLEIVNMEKQKVENLVREREIECEKKLEECKEETRQHLMRVREEHAALGLAYMDFSDDAHLAAAVAKNKKTLLGKKLSIAQSDPKCGKKEHGRSHELFYFLSMHISCSSAYNHTGALTSHLRVGGCFPKNNRHGTCIVAVIGHNFISIAGDGRSVGQLDANSPEIILEGNANKLCRIDRYLICAIAGDVIDALDMLTEVTSVCHHNNIQSVSNACTTYLENLDMTNVKIEGELMIFGYYRATPHVYNTDTRKCVPLEVGAVVGFGTGFEHAERYLLGRLRRFNLHRTREDFLNDLREAVVVASIECPSVGGFLTLATIPNERRLGLPVIHEDDHILQICSSRFFSIQRQFLKCVIVTAYGMEYAAGRVEYMNKCIKVHFPTSYGSNVIGVIKKRRRRNPTIIIQVVLFGSPVRPSQLKMKFGTVLYQSNRIRIQLLKPTRNLMQQYARAIKYQDF